MIKTIWKKYDEVFITLGILLLIVLFVVYKKKDTGKRGVITVAKITRYEPGESGGSLFADVYIDERIVEVLVNETCSNLKLGRYYFAKN